MTITKDITKDETKLNKFVGKQIVDFLLSNQANLNLKINSRNAVNYVFKNLGFTDPIFAEQNLRENVIATIIKTFNMLKIVEAVKSEENIVKNFEYFLKQKQSGNIETLENNYIIEKNFNKKLNLLKTNEIIKNSDVAVISINKRKHNVKIVNGVKTDEVIKCKNIFNYTTCCDFIGCYEPKKDMVSIFALKDEPKVFYATKGKHINPVKKEVRELSSLINYDLSIKNLFSVVKQNAKAK